MDDLLKVFDRDPPEKLLRLFAIGNKSELENYASDLIVTGDELFCLIVGARKAGYIHLPKFGEFQPDHLQPSRKELASLSERTPSEEREKLRSKLIGKIRQMFVERKIIAFHFFLARPRWHLISFTQRDATDIEKNHWVQGSHIHFVNDLWPGITPETILSRFPERPNGLHIRYKDESNQA